MQLDFAKFSDINLGDTFFDSLKSDYAEFETWFDKKSFQDESAYAEGLHVASREQALVAEAASLGGGIGHQLVV